MKQFQIESPFFKVDYKRLVLLLLPTFFRQPRIFAFLTAMTSSVSKLHEDFGANRLKNRRRLECNGQVCYLRRILNDELDSFERRIRISDAEQEGEWLMAVDEGDAYQLFVTNSITYVYSESLILNNTAYFNIEVPEILKDENFRNRLKNIVSEYKLITKEYNITYE